MKTVLLIILLQMLYVSLLSVRFILMVKGIRYLAAVISSVEIGIYFVGFKLVLDNLDRPLHLLAYCLSYGAGVLIGVRIEERLAIGYITVNVVTPSLDSPLPQRLREKGYGVTTWTGEGRGGPRLILSIVLKRKHQHRMFQEIYEIEPHAFVVAYEPKGFRGGFLTNH
ncbi:DUF2179 domain-containing protein [Brevibacillus thermoruber]|jgi:uncharacterized protein YebE (UPF0316 family)|uniref:UPF0316 protein O3V59_06045 n=2 Tax=Bacillales TaxID=1385 RepID=A0A9X3Z2L7_9BACL|nr:MULTISPECIES: DUF2179 domain-containing protein [Brevibacillus]MDA5107911.1 DUF2179 domain-containing protein [Brevibacillus thermoruber]TRY26554.1 DUF2179 domain-containing protein [Brevibacillus sp. LEMMJ03]UYZ15233.1 DUF2179 domain-containing protein [Brevibacillus sp. WF146]